jgi:hypothetical protein
MRRVTPHRYLPVERDGHWSLWDRRERVYVGVFDSRGFAVFIRRLLSDGGGAAS